MELTHQANPVRVNARVIDDIEQPTSETGFVAVLADGSRETLTAEMIARYAPVPGDYIVTQEDGYVYVNPKAVFERKYSAIPKPSVEVYSRPECVFRYCAAPGMCKAADRCVNCSSND